MNIATGVWRKTKFVRFRSVAIDGNNIPIDTVLYNLASFAINVGGLLALPAVFSTDIGYLPDTATHRVKAITRKSRDSATGQVCRLTWA